MTLRIRRLTPSAAIPLRVDPGAAGYDLAAAAPARIDAYGGIGKVSTGLAITVPPGTYGRIAPRSGLAAKKGIDVLAGVIDASYTGELIVLLINHGDQPFRIEAGDRVAQLILERCETPQVEEVSELEATVRGAGGFGSTGLAVRDG
jgi:dUTP pyrophosphatase